MRRIGVSKGVATEQSSGSDQELVDRIQAGEEAPFEVLLGRYQERVYRLALSLTKNPADAEEVLQDVFLTVYRKIAGFERRSAFGTWLYRIAVNTALMKLRARGLVQASIDEYLPQFTKDGLHVRMVADFTQGPEKLLLKKEREQVLRARGLVQASIDEYLPQFTKDGLHVRMVADFTQGPEKLLLKKEREQVLR